MISLSLAVDPNTKRVFALTIQVYRIIRLLPSIQFQEGNWVAFINNDTNYCVQQYKFKEQILPDLASSPLVTSISLAYSCKSSHTLSTISNCSSSSLRRDNSCDCQQKQKLNTAKFLHQIWRKRINIIPKLHSTMSNLCSHVRFGLCCYIDIRLYRLTLTRFI